MGREIPAPDWAPPVLGLGRLLAIYRERRLLADGGLSEPCPPTLLSWRGFLYSRVVDEDGTSVWLRYMNTRELAEEVRRLRARPKTEVCRRTLALLERQLSTRRLVLAS